jgi:hypothetical protein
MAHAKQGSRDEAERTMAELIRSFPDRSVERGRHGPDAAKLYDDVKKKNGALAPATVRVVPSDPKLTIFVNDRYAGAGGFSSSTIIPGPYRVYAQLGNDTGRIHLVTVEPGEKQTVDIDWGFDSTFRSANWRGFVFRSRSERTARETEYARRVMEATGADSVIILSFGENSGRPALYASLWSGTPLATTRAGLVILQGKDSDLESVRALTRFAATSERSESVIVKQTDVPEPKTRFRYWKWVTAGTAAGVVATGVMMLVCDRCDGIVDGARTPTYVPKWIGSRLPAPGSPWLQSLRICSSPTGRKPGAHGRAAPSLSPP